MSFVRDVGAVLTASTPRAVEQPQKPLPSAHIGRVRCPEPMTAKQVCIVQHILPSLTDKILRDRVVPIISQESKVSLRSLDWAVVNYAKKHGVVIRHHNDIVDVHHAYLVALSHWRRRNFDPFRRRTRCYFTLDGVEYETTPGQLCFLTWASRIGVYDYVAEHIDAIESDMCATNARCRAEAREAPLGKRRRELSAAQHVRCVIRETHSRLF